ncbi:cupin domain-containing protein [Eubacteriales bacterium KG127]
MPVSKKFCEELSIHEVAKLLKVTTTTIRNWEKSGLFIAKRKGNNYRVYSPVDISYLKKIKQYSIEEGISSKFIKKLLAHDLTFHRTVRRNKLKSSYKNKLKAKREMYQYSLEYVSCETGIKIDVLKALENDDCVSFDTIKILADFYKESMLSFFDIDNESLGNLIKKGDGYETDSPLEGVEILVLSEQSSPFIFTIFTVAQGAGDYNAHRHNSGEEFIYVLSGKLTVILDERQVVMAQSGDVIRFESSRMHEWHNAGVKTLKMIWIHTSL